MGKRLLSGNLAAPFFCVVAVVLNQSIFRLGMMPLMWAGLFVAAVAFITVSAPDVRLSAALRPRLRWPNVLFGVVIVAPLLITFALGWNRDFPFSGDHYFHVGQSYRLAYWWLSPPASPVVRVPTLEEVQSLLRHPAGLAASRLAVLLLLATASAAIYRKSRLTTLLFATFAVVSWGLCEKTIFLRYPGAGYFVAMPFLGPAFFLHNVELAGRAANVIAPVVWLFALRPWLVGRWPDLRVLPIGALLFWQKDVIYYFDSVYLEPWSFTFCLLAVEMLIARGSRGAPLGCLLIGAAAAVKEPAIFALPLVWLAGAPWRKPWGEMFTLSGSALSAGTAFVLYYGARNSTAAEVEIEAARGFQFGLPGGPLMPYAQEYAHRFQAAFSLTGGLLFLAALIALLVMIWWLPSRRLQIACLAAAGAALLLFFLVDTGSMGWIGYFRFSLAAMPFLGAGALALGYALRRNAALITGAMALVLQAPSASNAIGKAAGPITGLNFIENYDAPIFFPMKSLLAEAKQKALLPSHATVLANAPDTSIRAIPGIPVTYGLPGVLMCECSQERPAVMSLFVHYANLAAPFTHNPSASGPYSPPQDRDRLWRSGLAERPMCLAKLQQSCGHVLQRVESGELVAVLGTSK